MNTNNENPNVKNELSAQKRAESKTARKYRSPFPQDQLPQAVSVNIDWLSFMCECLLNEPEKDQPPTFLDHMVVELSSKPGIQLFKYSWNVYRGGEKVAMVHTHTRQEKIIKPGTAKVEISNNVLYSNEVLEVIDDVMNACKMTVIKNLTRIDISIDGVSHIHKFLNQYIRQPKTRAIPELQTIGKSEREQRIKMKGKAALHAKMFNKKSGMFDAFKIGASRKCVVLYNKTSELERSHKEYIREAWERAGLDVTKDVWRCEVRLSSEAIKDIDGGFDLKRMYDPNYLLQVFKTQCNNFFEFVDMEGQTNVTCGRIIDLLQFEKLKVPLLARVPRAVIDGAYKAKMAIHNGIKDVLHNLHSVKQRIDFVNQEISYNVQAALTHVADNINRYNLRRWYEKKLPVWNLLYSPPFTGNNSDSMSLAMV